MVALLGTMVAGLVGTGSAHADNHVTRPGYHINSIINRPCIGAGCTPTTFAYVPSQFFVVSGPDSGANYSFDVWGGGVAIAYDGAGQPYAHGGNGDFVFSGYVHIGNDDVYIGPPGGAAYYYAQHPDVLEVYQLRNGQSGPGAKSRRKQAIDTNTLPSDAPHTISGTGDAGADNLFYDPAYPQYNGHYVFLVKMVHDFDQDHGFIRQVDLNGLGCVNDPSGSPSLWSPADGTVTCPDTTYEPHRNGAGDVIVNAFTMSSPQGLVSAPVNLSIDIKQDQDYGGQTDIPLDIPASGAGGNCRPTAAYAGVSNADWDANTDHLTANVTSKDPAGNTVGSHDYPWNSGSISDNWSSGIKHMRTDAFAYPDFQFDDPTIWGQLAIYGWNFDNNLYVGGAQFGGGTPLCQSSLSVDLITPKASSANYTYNGYGQDRYKQPDHAAEQSSLDFRFRINTNVEVAKWRMLLDGAEVDSSDWSTDVNTDLTRSRTGLTPGSHTWEVCAYASGTTQAPTAGGEVCSGSRTFSVNYGGDGANQQSAVDNASGYDKETVKWNGLYLKGQVNDPDASSSCFLGHIQPYFHLSWLTPDGQTGALDTSAGALVSNGATVSSDDVRVHQYSIGTATHDYGGGTLTQFLRDTQTSPGTQAGLGPQASGYSENGSGLGVVREGSEITWALLAGDTLGTSDSVTQDCGIVGDPEARRGNNPKYGVSNTWTVHKDTRAAFAPATVTKQYFDVSDTSYANPLTNISNGQTVKVRLNLVNSGDTPMPYYQVIDYLGPVRDFQDPGQFTATYNNGTPEGVAPTVTKVIAANHSDPSADSVSNNAADPNLAYRFDYGNNDAGPLHGQIQAHQALVLTYVVRANRNINAPANPDYRRVLNVGDPVTPSDAHTYTYYQQNYFSTASRIRRVFEFRPGAVLAPITRGQRGSAGSNGSVSSYDDAGATYTVTAGGTISHFSGQNKFSNYQPDPAAQAGACPGETNPQGLNWRNTMITQLEQLLRTTTPSNTAKLNALLASGNLSTLPGNVLFYQGDVHIPASGVTWSGTGTLIVQGNLYIDGNTSYANAGTSPDSLGVIVLPRTIGGGGNPTVVPGTGNIYVAPGVTHVVGSYYALDSTTTLTQSGGATCAVGISDANVGTISTGTRNDSKGDVPLRIDGLLVARAFNLQRQYTNTTTPSLVDPAEYVYYDGRVVADPPPGFGTFRTNTSWYEITP
jgi:hypothetical protein